MGNEHCQQMCACGCQANSRFPHITKPLPRRLDNKSVILADPETWFRLDAGSTSFPASQQTGVQDT